MTQRNLKTREDFLSRHPCIKQASKKDTGGWYKKELQDFCLKNKVPGCDNSSTKPQLCKVIARYFDNIATEASVSVSNSVQIQKHDLQTRFESKSCSSARGDGTSNWRVVDLKDMLKELGLTPASKAKKSDLCKQIADYFRTLDKDPVFAQPAPVLVKPPTQAELTKMTIAQLRHLCIERNLRGCKQTKKKETFLKKLKVEVEPSKGISKKPSKLSSKIKSIKTPPRKSSLQTPSVKTPSVRAPQKAVGKRIATPLSLGKKSPVSGKLLKKEVNSVVASLSAMLYLHKLHKNVMCLPLLSQELKESDFGKKHHYCDFEICWSFTTAPQNKRTSVLRWTYGMKEKFFFEKIKTECKQRLVAVPLYLLATVIGLDGKEHHFAHHNYVIIDRDMKTLERFEPNGTRSMDGMLGAILGSAELDKQIKEATDRYGYEYIEPLAFCPVIGPHLMQPKGKVEEDELAEFCTFWSLWYADRRLKYPDIPAKTLIEQLLRGFQKDDQSMFNFIRNYIEFFDKERRALIEDARDIAGDVGDKLTPLQIVVNAVIEELERS